MLKIYLAAMYSEKDNISKQAAIFRSHDFVVTSTWLEEPHAPTIKMAEVATDSLLEYAQNDIRDISEADWFVCQSVEPTTLTVRGGRHVEFGYALAKGKKILVVGPKENIFHLLPNIKHVDNWESALLLLKTTAVLQGE